MILFWVLAAIMILAALLLVVPSLMRGSTSDRDTTVETNVALYRERLTDLERERERGEIDPDRYAALREDLERGLLDDVGTTSPDARTDAHPPPYWMAALVTILIPVGGLAFYMWLGSPHGLAPQAEPHGADARVESDPSVEAMVDSLAAKLANDPADSEGWLLLARSQVVLERFDAAIVAFNRAHALLGDTPDLLVDWAEAEAAAAGNRFPARAMLRIERALELDSDHEKALWLGGFAAAQNGRTDTAIARWERLRDQQTPGSRGASIVSELLAQVQGTANAAPAPNIGSAGTAERSTPAEPAVTRDGARIVVEVSLAPDIAVELGASEPVFVFARTPSGGGPPVAVARTIVGALPATIVLDESSAMVPSLSLASVERVLVTARVARSGTVTRSSGDIEGVSGPLAVADTAPASVVISNVVP